MKPLNPAKRADHGFAYDTRSSTARLWRTGAIAAGVLLGLIATVLVVVRPTTAVASVADRVIVRAHGTSGQEQMVLKINGQDAASWTVSRSPQNYEHRLGGTVDVDALEVAFVNDFGATRDLIVDYVDLGGVLLQSESRSTVSTGTFVPGQGCVRRASISSTLHCRGSFIYDVPADSPAPAPTQPPVATPTQPPAATPSPAGTTVSVRALGSTGAEQFELHINGAMVLSETASTGWTTFTHDLGANVSVATAEVRFVNDNGPRDLRVDYFAIGDTRFQSENPSTFARGIWVDGRCNEGSAVSEWLYCGGLFRYPVAGAPAPAPTATPAPAPTAAPAPAPTATPAPAPTATPAPAPTATPAPAPTATPAPAPAPNPQGRYTIAQVIEGTISAGDGSNPNEEAPMGRHDASLSLPQGWNWAQGPTRNSVWGQLGTGGSQFVEFRCAVIPESGHTPPVPFRINVREGAYYQFVNGQWNKAFDVDLTGGNRGGYLGTAGQTNSNPFASGGHGQIQWRREADGSFSAPWNSQALMMHFWASRRQPPAPGQTAEFLTSEVRLQQPDGQSVDLSRVRVLFQCGADYYSTTGGQGVQVPGPGIGKYHRATQNWKPSLWVTLPRDAPAASVADFQRWLQNNRPPGVS